MNSPRLASDTDATQRRDTRSTGSVQRSTTAISLNCSGQQALGPRQRRCQPVSPWCNAACTEDVYARPECRRAAIASPVLGSYDSYEGCPLALAEWIGDPDAAIILAVVEVFGQDLSAAHHTGCLDDRGVPVRELESLASVQSRPHDPARDVLDRKAPERLDEPDRLVMPDGIRTTRAGRLHVELLQHLT